MVIVLGLDEEECCNAVLVWGERLDGFPVIFGTFLKTNRPASYFPLVNDIFH